MPIIDLQRRLYEIGRIRIGVQVPTTTKNGRRTTRPEKLTTFRLTSKDPRAIAAAAALYGGEPHPWEEQPGAHELITETAELNIAVPPGGAALSQWYELWSGGGCQRRCDGQWEQIGDQPCVCDPVARECSAHTRLSVVLRDLPGLGMWRLDTQGWYAATELPGTISLLEAAAEQGRFLPARLRLEQREVKRPGEKPKKFAVPVVDLDVPVMQIPALISGSGSGQPALAAGPDPDTGELPPASGGLTPVPDVLQGPTVADQVKAQDNPPSRSRASTPQLPATGRRTRTAAEAAAAEPDKPWSPQAGATPEAPPAPQEPWERAGMTVDQFVAMRGRELNVDHHRVCEAYGYVGDDGRPTAKVIPPAEAHRVIDAMQAVDEGLLILEHDEDHRWSLRERDDLDGPISDDQRALVEAELRRWQDNEAVIDRAKAITRMRVVGVRTLDGPNPKLSIRHGNRILDALDTAVAELGLSTPAPAEEPPADESSAEPDRTYGPDEEPF